MSSGFLIVKKKLNQPDKAKALQTIRISLLTLLTLRSVFNRILRFHRHDVLCGGSVHSRTLVYDQVQLSLPSSVLLHLQGGRERRHQPGLWYILLTGRREEGKYYGGKL